MSTKIKYARDPIKIRKSISYYIEKSETQNKADPYEQYNPSVLRTFYKQEGEYGKKIKTILDDHIQNVEGSIVELGCGTGNLIAHLAEKNALACCLGLDYSYQMLSQATKAYKNEVNADLKLEGLQNGFRPLHVPVKNLPNLEFALCDACDTPLADQSVDLCISAFLWDRLKEPGKLLQEAKRIIKIGGKFILLTPFNYNHRENWQKCDTQEKVILMAEKMGLELVLSDLIDIKEVLDASDNYILWKTHVFIFR